MTELPEHLSEEELIDEFRSLPKYKQYAVLAEAEASINADKDLSIIEGNYCSNCGEEFD